MMTEITFPVASILENAEAIVNACEDLELSPNKSTQDESSSSSSSSSSPSPSASSMPNIILTELAALIHLRQYSHAKHLWKRYSSQQDNPQLQQFVTLWKAVTPLLRAHSQDCTTTIDASTLGVGVGVGVGDSTGGGDISNVYGSLQACQHMNPKLEPLATYSVQLQTSIRETFAKAIERSFESIEHKRCKMLLGYLNNGDTSDGDMDKFLMGRNWSKEMGTSLWIPYYNPATRNVSASKENSSDNDSDVYGNGNVHVHVHAGSSSSNRIEYLTQMVGFMETQRFNV